MIEFSDEDIADEEVFHDDPHSKRISSAKVARSRLAKCFCSRVVFIESLIRGNIIRSQEICEHALLN